MRKDEPSQFRSPPPIPSRIYHSMDALEYDEMCAGVYRDNNRWFSEKFPDPRVRWALITRDGRVTETGYDDSMPSMHDIRQRARSSKRQLFLLSRSSEYLGLDIYFDAASEHKLLNILKRDPEEVTRYSKEGKICQMRVQSGVLNKLEPHFALGRLKLEGQKIGGVEYHTEGALAVTVTNYLADGKKISIAPQSAAHIRARGSTTREEEEPGKWIRIERLHRFDKPILDIFDSWKVSKLPEWPDLLLYEAKEFLRNGSKDDRRP